MGIRPGWPKRLAGPFLLLLVAIALHWKILLTDGQYTWLGSPDMSTQVLPWFQFQAREWNRGHFPLWDPYNWGGQSLVGRTEPGVLYPLNWILFRLPLDQGRISLTFLNWYYVLTHYLGALFCYFLCRDLGRSAAAGVFAGTVFGLSGFLGTTQWPQAVNGAVWGPLVLLFFLRAMRGDRPHRHIALSGAFLGVALLGGHHQVPIFIALLVMGLWVYYFFAAHWRFRHHAQLAALFIVFAFLLSAAQLLPSLEYGKLSQRWVGALTDPLGWSDKVPYLVHESYSLHPLSLLGVVLPGIHPRANPGLGLVVVALALIAVATLWGRREVRLCGALALGGLLFALGGASLFHGLSYALLPAVEKARNPSAAIYVFHLGAALLAAYGLDALREPGGRAPTVAGRLALGLWVFSALVYLVLLCAYFAWQDKVYLYWRPAAAAVAGLLAGAALLGFRRGALSVPALHASLFLVLLFETGNITAYSFMQRFQPGNYLSQLSLHLEILEFLRNQPGAFRVEIGRAEVPFNFGEWHEVEECAGNSGVTTNIHRVQGEYNAHLLMGERFSVGSAPRWPGQVEVFRAPSDLRIYRNQDAFPRVWTVHELVGIAGTAQIVPNIARPLAELRRQAFLVGEPPQVDTCEGADQLDLLAHGKTQIRVQANMRCKGMLILADTFFPGWKATVDGREVPIYEVYGFLRGVIVDAGEHDLRMIYRPRSLFTGAALTLAGAWALAVVLFCTRGKSRTGDFPQQPAR